MCTQLSRASPTYWRMMSLLNVTFSTVAQQALHKDLGGSSGFSVEF